MALSSLEPPSRIPRLRSMIPTVEPLTGDLMGLRTRSRSQRGIAIILVVFIVALATIIVLSLTTSTYLIGRLESAQMRSLQAEYLLKSAVNIARVLLKEDTSPEDAIQDPTWGPFVNGMIIPPELLGIAEPNVRVQLEIRPEEAKIPLRGLVPTSFGQADPKWRGVLTRLFQSPGLDFDNDTDETDSSGYFAGKHFTSEEVVASLIDYIDADKDPYKDPNGGFAEGIEDKVPTDLFPNEQIRRLGELATIPGFTATRIRKVLPYLTTFGGAQRININIAPRAVIRALHPDITDGDVDQIIAFRTGPTGPFTLQNKREEIGNIIGTALYDLIETLIDVESKWFQVIAKVDYGTSSFFVRAYLLEQGTGTLPTIRSIELY